MKRTITLMALLFTAVPFFSQGTYTAAEAEEETSIFDYEITQREKNLAEGTSDQAENLIISSINIEGLRKTKEHIIQNDLKRFIGQKADKSTIHSIETVLQGENLFSVINIEPKVTNESTVEVEITLKEKISFLAVPFAAYSSNSGFMGGAFVCDMNALGLRNSYMAGGIVTEKSLMLMSAYSKPQKGSSPAISLFAGFSKDDTEIHDEDDNKVLEFSTTGGWITASTEHKFFNLLSIGSGVSAGIKEIDDERISNIAFDGKIGIQSKDWNGYFMSEKRIDFTGKMNFSTDSSDIQKTLQARVSIQQPLFFVPRFRICTDSALFLSQDLEPYAYGNNGDAAVSLFPNSFKSDFLFGNNFGFEVATISIKRIGLISVYGQYQQAIANNFKDETIFNAGVASGIRVYFAQLAFPAISGGAVYNITTNTFNYSFSLGMGF